MLLASGGAVARAATADVPWHAWGRPLVPLGWTADGEFFVFTRQVEYYPLETIDDETIKPWKLVFGVVREARTGRERPYVLELSDESGSAIRREEFAQTPGPGAWKTWLAEHPLRLLHGQRAPGGAHAQVTGTVRGGAVAPMPWQRERFRFALPSGEPVRLTLAIVDESGRVWPSLATGDGSDGFVGEAEPLWSPDGRRVAWWLEEKMRPGDEHGPTQYVVIAAVGPHVELVVSPDDESRAWNAIDRLEDASAAPVYVQRAAAHVTETVIKAAPGREDDARALGARLPGGARVETMTALSEFDLSIAAGPALMEPLSAPRARLPRQIAARDRHTWFGLAVAFAATLVVWLLSRRRSR